MIDQCEVVVVDDGSKNGTPQILGKRSSELASAIRDASLSYTPTGEHLGMGFRAFSTFDLTLILSRARESIVDSL